MRLIISPDGSGDSLQVRQDVRVYAGQFDGDQTQMFIMPDIAVPTYMSPAAGSS